MTAVKVQLPKFWLYLMSVKTEDKARRDPWVNSI